MKQEALTQFPDIWMTVTALILFFSAFTGLLWWTYVTKKKEDIESLASIALEKE